MTSAEQIKNIESLRGAALREKFHEVVGTETRSKDRPYLIKKIVQVLQARAEAAPETITRARTKKTAPTKTPAARSGEKKRERDPRLPTAGTIIEREHDGKTVRVKVLEDSFEYGGRTYRSLSAIAREVTGCTWNGLLWARLIPYAKRDAKKAA